MTARPRFPKFQGPFKSFSVSLFTNREKGTESRLIVYSQGSRTVVSNYLWLKFLWDELTKEEMTLFLTLSETLKSEIKYAALRATLIKGKRYVRNKLIQSSLIPESESPTKIRYQGYKRVDIEIHNETRNLPKVPKFSGWVKSGSAIGSKRRPGGPSYLEPLAIIENDYADIVFDWYNYLTVDDLNNSSQ
jgi:hypothetical protein